MLPGSNAWVVWTENARESFYSGRAVLASAGCYRVESAPLSQLSCLQYTDSRPPYRLDCLHPLLHANGA